MFTRRTWTPPSVPRGLDRDVEKYLLDLNKSIADYLRSLEARGSLTINEASLDSSPVGSSSPSTGKFTTISASGQVTSTVSTGTAPMVVASTTKVSNLNADLLDGVDAAAFQLASGYTAADVLSKLLTVDGSGSGLDADKVDGYNVAEAATASTIAARDSSGGLTVDRITATSAIIGNTGGIDSLAATLANNAASTVTGSGDAACGLLIIRDVNAGGVALLLVDPGIAGVSIVSDPSSIIGAAKWDVTTSGNNVVLTNKWGASRTHKSTYISTGGAITFA